MEIERIQGGQSNPTFFVNYDNSRLVVRKQPAGTLLPSAHAVDREFRVMAALAGSGVPVPEVLFLEPGSDAIGTPFYVMKRLEGRVFSDGSMPGVAPAERRTMILAMAEVLARLHRLDVAELGLQDHGRPGNFFERQIARWSRQWQATVPSQSADMHRLMNWLKSRVPASEVTSLVHGDFRISNLMFHPSEPRIVGVLDWELSTLGHPLADVAYCALAWKLTADQYMGIKGLDLRALGIPGEQEFLDRYHAWAPASGKLEPFHTVFSLFRLAAIFEGIAARARQGIAAADNADQVGRLGPEFARLAIEYMDAA